MGKDWDSKKDQTWHEEWLAEAYRVLPPGGVIKAFSGTRTFHRLAAAMEAVGFELVPEESLAAWVYASGFPKSLDVSKAIDKLAGAERQVTGTKPGHEGFDDRAGISSVQSLATGVLGGEGGFARPWMNDPDAVVRYHQQTAPATDDAKRFEGYGTALKPAWEPVLIGRKPSSGSLCDVLSRLNKGRPPSGIVSQWSEEQVRHAPFRVPSFREELLRRFNERDELPLSDLVKGLCDGSYAIYYNGDMPCYRELVRFNRTAAIKRPVYVGSASQGEQIAQRDTSRQSLTGRFRTHKSSILEARNLRIQDFTCRFLFTEDCLELVAERYLIKLFQPVWNVLVTGFGITGSCRDTQRRSRWDTVHRGRKRAAKLAFDEVRRQRLLHRIEDFLAEPLAPSFM